uniref:Uncharacterized protein n=1 Tax=Anopheles melas TaxID=34690 RepID=A0A182UHQ0_9DIPT
MPAPLKPAPTAAPSTEINKLIDDVFVTSGAAINCGALRRLLQQLTALIQPGSGGGSCRCCCSASRVTIDGRSLKKSTSKTRKLSARSSTSKTKVGAKGGKDADKEHELILQKLQAVQTMLKVMEQKIAKIETRLPKSQSNVSLGKGGGRRGQNSKASSIRVGGGRGADQVDKLSEFTDKLDELQRQMELLLSHRDQLPLRIEALLEEKLREGELMTSSKKSLQTDGGVSSRKGSVTPSRSCSQGRIAESAGTTQPASENLSCLSCDTKNVVQRKRDGRYLAPRTSAKLAMIARRLEESDAVPRLKPGARWSRTCGGSYTVVKPDERVFRQVNVQFNRTMQGESSANDS